MTFINLNKNNRTILTIFIAIVSTIIFILVLQATVDFNNSTTKNVYIESSNIYRGETLARSKVIQIDIVDNLTAKFYVDDNQLPITSVTSIESTKEYSIKLPTSVKPGNHILKVEVIDNNAANPIVDSQEIPFKTTG